MPPQVRYPKQKIVEAAFRLTRRGGIVALNARALAAEMGCSTQPIFREYHTMEEIKTEMLRMGMERYAAYVTNAAQRPGRHYLAAGMAYIAFAREEPELFKYLFMRDRVADGTVNVQQDDTAEYVLQLVMNSTGLTKKEAEGFHLKLWVFAHGLASMIATRFITISQEDAQRMMVDEYRAMRMLYGLPPVKDDR